MSLPEIFSDTLHKTAIDMFETTPATYLRILRRKSHTDFHKSTELRPYSKNGYSEMGKDSEIKHDVLGLATYVSQVKKTFAKQYSVTRHDWIQDSTGFLAAYPTLIAQDAQKLVSKLAYTALLSAGNFFSAANKNLLTGANSALSVDSLSDAIRLLREQLDEVGEPVSFAPATLLVSPALESTAKTILASQEIRRDDGSGVYGVGNPHERALELVVERLIGS